MKNKAQLQNDFANTCPLLLKDEQLENPYLVIMEFFSKQTLGQYRRAIDTWFQSALHEDLKHPEPESLIYFHQQIQTLLQASYLIAHGNLKLQLNQAQTTPELHPFHQLAEASDPHSRADHSYAQPYWLNLTGRENPIAFLKATLSLENLKEIRLGLQQWLEDGLITHSCLADTEAVYSFALYQQLQQLLEACHLLLFPQPNLMLS
ncbi:MAG: hypothetical protein EOO90_03820 [Pedobacter sp.]|nr:MAG: hypothetical protein EOO90_03820 [Pedobacter sp.]